MHHTDNFKQLVEHLREIFQGNRSGLDFGLYRIMNAKSDAITHYLDNELLPQVQLVLGQLPQNVDIRQVEQDLYFNLHQFFKRYYSEGEFTSLQRYKNEPHTLPYDGEDVKLYWANHDQYYIKTTEDFKSYTFKTGNGKRVRFEVVAAVTKNNNNKATDDKDRRFILHSTKPIIVEGDQCIIRFEYGVDNQKRKQSVINAETFTALKDRFEIQGFALGDLSPTDKDKTHTLLKKHLTDFTAKNTFDYFIHKDLGQFLRRELDFYIKNEILHLDDIENVLNLESSLHKIKALRLIAGKIIEFLSQIEDFQKKLWLKKKFVLQTNYCVTLDYIIGSDIADTLLAIIASNDKQREEWVKLFAIDELGGLCGYTVPLTEQFLKDNDKLLVDTRFFDMDFKYKLLSIFDNLDDQTDGLLVNSENFQALNLLKERYREKVKCIYIDPPYNTGASEIIYKNGYKHSSWLSLIHSRLKCSAGFFSDGDHALCIAIDDTELANLSKLIESYFNNYDLFRVIVNHYPGSGTGRSNVTRTHEYALFAVPKNEDVLRGEEKDEGSRERNFRRSGTGENNYRTGRKNSFYAVLVNPNTLEVIGRENPPALGSSYPTDDTDDRLKRIYPIGEDGAERVWTLSYEGFENAYSEGLIKCTKNMVITRLYKDKATRNLLQSVWLDKQFNAVSNGTNLLKNMFGISDLFSYPKSIYTVSNAIEAITHDKKDALILDYFAGSGTTGHATINLNREDNGNRKYIMVEMGEYFSKVTLPRVMKASYSSEWKKGKPVTRDGVSQVIKYMSLEQYEDTLNNLDLNRTDKQTVILNIENPFAYKMHITRDDDTQTVNIDCIETFNYLLGLTVRTVKRHHNGMVEIQGTNSQDEKCLILWRDITHVNNQALGDWFNKHYSVQELEFDAIYVNGDNNLANLKMGESMRNVRPIELEFNRLIHT